MKHLLIALLLFALPGAALAQPAAPAPHAIEKLDFLLGEWKGEGWIQNRDGTRENFTSTEIIQKKLAGTALLIEGVHTGFEALAVVTYDEKAKQYRWRSFTSRGGGVDVEAKLVGDRELQWQPSPQSRYTIKISESGLWEEVGEYSLDQGKTWKQFFAMRLQRTPG